MDYDVAIVGSGPAGITRSLMQASVSGVLIAQDILRKENSTCTSTS